VAVSKEMVTKPRIYFIGLTPLGMLPLMRYIIPFFRNYDVHIITIHIKKAYRFDEAGVQHDVMVYPDTDTFNSHTINNKFRKFAGFIYQIFRSTILQNNNTVYTVDFQIAAVLIWIKKKWKPQLRIVYHQFEAFESDMASGITRKLQQYLMKYAEELDLVVFPEVNRQEFFTSRINVSTNRTFLIPNSNNLPLLVPENNNALPERNQNKTIIAHVGNLSASHYTFSFLDFIRTNKEPELEFLFIGPIDPEVNPVLQKLAASDNRVVLVGSISHVELLPYYAVIGIGVILYRGIDLNNEYCAPNKLYEYWSQGIPVIAHTLKGLTSIWSHNFMGNLVDMNDPDDVQRGLDTIKRDLPSKHIALRSWFEREGNLDIYLRTLKEKVTAI
jgi:glycosyltransferase involved in cell wall biosynthesis